MIIFAKLAKFSSTFILQDEVLVTNLLNFVDLVKKIMHGNVLSKAKCVVITWVRHY